MTSGYVCNQTGPYSVCIVLYWLLSCVTYGIQELMNQWSEVAWVDFNIGDTEVSQEEEEGN